MRSHTILPVAAAAFFGLATAQAVPSCALPVLSAAIRDYPGDCTGANPYICFCQNQEAQWYWTQYAARDCPTEADAEGAIAFGTRLCGETGFPITFPVPSPPAPTLPSSTADGEVTPTPSDPPPVTSDPATSDPGPEPSETPSPTESASEEPPASTLNPSTFITTPSPTGTSAPCTDGNTKTKTKTAGPGGDDDDCDCPGDNDGSDHGSDDNDSDSGSGHVDDDSDADGDDSGKPDGSVPTPEPTFVLVNMAKGTSSPIALGVAGVMAAMLGMI